ncbi:MAG: purine-nucleoside phosphorylase [Planctomycetota bacterium]
MSYAEQLDAATTALERSLGGVRPRVGLVLGSGLSASDLALTDKLEISIAAIPHLPQPRVSGHGRNWILGELGRVPALIAAGRVHLYEGHSAAHVTFGVRLMARVGCTHLIITNAAGGIRDDLQPGSLMRISDHINLQGVSPLTGVEAQFVDMSASYDMDWGRAVDAHATRSGVELRSGVYAGVLGPQYETPAEIRYLRTIGADAVGMSTVLEVIAARAAGLRVFGLSLISNRAAGLSDGTLSHAEVLATGKAAARKIANLIADVAKFANKA